MRQEKEPVGPQYELLLTALKEKEESVESVE